MKNKTRTALPMVILGCLTLSVSAGSADTFHDTIAHFVASPAVKALPPAAPSGSSPRSPMHSASPAPYKRIFRARRILYYRPRYVDLVWNGQPTALMNRARLINGVTYVPLVEIANLLEKQGVKLDVSYSTVGSHRTVSVSVGAYNRANSASAGGSVSAPASHQSGTAILGGSTLPAVGPAQAEVVFGQALRLLYGGKFRQAEQTLRALTLMPDADADLKQSAEETADWIASETNSDSGLVRFRWKKGATQPDDLVIWIDNQVVPRNTLFSVASKGNHTVTLRNFEGRELATDRIVLADQPLTYTITTNTANKNVNATSSEATSDVFAPETIEGEGM